MRRCLNIASRPSKTPASASQHMYTSTDRPCSNQACDPKKAIMEFALSSGKTAVRLRAPALLQVHHLPQRHYAPNCTSARETISRLPETDSDETLLKLPEHSGFGAQGSDCMQSLEYRCGSSHSLLRGRRH